MSRLKESYLEQNSCTVYLEGDGTLFVVDSLRYKRERKRLNGSSAI